MVNITCNIASNPVVDFQDIEWYKDGEDTGTRGPYYLMKPAKRMDAGNYTCSASNMLRPSGGGDKRVYGTKSLFVVVMFVPGQATITGPDYAIKGEEATLYCSVDNPGEPTARLNWTKVGSSTILGTGNEFKFNAARLSEDGMYVCTPYNEVGDGGQGTKRFVVNEYPEFIGPDGSLPANKEVDETDTGLTATCSIRGRPLPTIKWYKDNVEIVSSESEDFYKIILEESTIEGVSYNVTSTLVWEGRGRTPSDSSLRIEDAGIYSCVTKNDISTKDLRSDMKLEVRYVPVIDMTGNKVATDLNSSALLSCQAHSFPTPVFEWYNGSTKLATNDRLTISTITDPTSQFQFQSYLNISEVGHHDLGEYKCLCMNQLGSQELKIQLTVKTKPDPPLNVRILEKTWESVQLQWDKGFDGGYPQWFIVKYTSNKHQSKRVEVQPPQNNTFNVTKLFPSTNYTFMVFGENILGGGDYSLPISAVTEYFAVDPPFSL